jgi:hypothetical protein
MHLVMKRENAKGGERHEAIVRPCGHGFEYVIDGRGYYCETMDEAIRQVVRHAKKAGGSVRVMQESPF